MNLLVQVAKELQLERAFLNEITVTHGEGVEAGQASRNLGRAIDAKVWVVGSKRRELIFETVIVMGMGDDHGSHTLEVGQRFCVSTRVNDDAFIVLY